MRVLTDRSDFGRADTRTRDLAHLVVAQRLFVLSQSLLVLSQGLNLGEEGLFRVLVCSEATSELLFLSVAGV